MTNVFRRAVSLSLLCLAVALCTSVRAAYPEKPVRMVVPSAPGGALDTAARVLADRLSKLWGQPVVVENRAGAVGAIGTDLVVASPADGYTLLVNGSIMMAVEVTRPGTRYRTQRDLIPVSLMATTPSVFVASNEATRGSLQDILAAGAARPGELTYGSLGEGTTGHYLGEKLGKAGQAQVTHVPFGGEAQMLTALIGGHLKTSWLTGLSARKAADTGKVRLLAVASPRRSQLLPEVPTFAELGYAGFDRGAWVMVLAPMGTPTAIVEQVSRDIDGLLKQPEQRQSLFAQGLEARGGTPADALREVQAEHAFWTGLVKEFGSLVK